ncbi:MAG: hypothetical protein KIT35_20085 [Piscinibacter sp.]|uniref:hypothetical protein n=1 Tax=Piscinibacter sp. TaxID=1903157 RepID=UPI002588D7F2|nr:hypothetical protein [Piscinibacter sp.]MCW5666136.1 hypothetical protein [Piscinibacter sp.]
MGDEWKAAFKAAFKQKEAEEAAAAQAAKQAQLAKAAAEKEAEEARIAEHNAKNKLGLAEKARKPDAEKVRKLTGEHQTAQQEHEKAKAKVASEAQAIETAKAQEKTAREEKEEIARAEKRGEYSQTIKVYKRRLAAAGKSNALDAQFKLLEPLYLADDFEGLAKQLKVADDLLLATVAATEAAAMQADRLKRLDALKRKPFDGNQDLKAIGLKLAATAEQVKAGQLVEALKVLEREITPLLADCEKEADAYEVLQAELEQRVAALMANEYRSQAKLDEVAAARKKAAHAAHTGRIVDANALLGSADAALADAEEWADENASHAQTYPALLAQLEQDVKDFLAVHKGFRLECDHKVGGWMKSAALNAGEKAGHRNFESAAQMLGEAAAALVGLEAKAKAVLAKLAQKAQDAAEQAAQQQAKAQAAANAQAAKLAAETALVPSSLAAIGKSHIDKWVVQLGRLLQGPTPVCTLTGGTTTFWLPGNTTVESICSVRHNGTVVDTFVVHYHPSAKFSDPSGSPMHAKPRRGNATTPHHYMRDDHWLVADGHVKSHAAVKKEYL